jgi:hypothetical protein
VNVRLYKQGELECTLVIKKYVKQGAILVDSVYIPLSNLSNPYRRALSAQPSSLFTLTRACQCGNTSSKISFAMRAPRTRTESSFSTLTDRGVLRADPDWGLPLRSEACVARTADEGVCTVFVDIGVCNTPGPVLGVTGILD